ncbi:hypothetical protein MCAP1_000359 [Malassezia caprae]|uniref:Proteophosphoglycan ppg4 n=1 Tax=Malassezia caprae TaxID=1381934 RepID=A0AAF0E7G5_9BASI|nr:hypothetical protein MCAP1_000359 [Malassezia caprae]
MWSSGSTWLFPRSRTTTCLSANLRSLYMLGSTSSARSDTGDPDQTTFERVSELDREHPAPISVDAMSDSDMDEAPRLGPAASPQPTSTRLYQNVNARNTGSASSSHFVIVIPPPEMPTTALPRSASAPTLARRGTLLPLYPTLGGQLYAIAREYGLPSVGGISLYLVDDGNGNDGPRIGDSTWAALWSGFFDEEERETAPPMPDVSDSELYFRPTPLPYMRKSQPSPRLRQSSRESSRRLPRMASNASLTSTRSASAASFTLETGRLPIVGKFEWSVDPVKAKWWRPFLAHAEAIAEMATSPNTDGPPLPTPRTSGHRPLHLATMATPSPVRAQTLPARADTSAPSSRTDIRDSIVPAQPQVQTRDAPIIAASPSGPSPSGTEAQELLTAPPSVPDVLSPPSSVPEMQTAPTSLAEAPPSFDESATKAPAPHALGSPIEQSYAAPRSEPSASDDGATDKAPADPSQPADEPLTPIQSSPPPLPTRQSTASDMDDESKKRTTMSGAVASLSAAASRLFGGHKNDAPAQEAPEEAPEEDAVKPQTPTSPQHNVEEARELLTERERKSANARRHMQRASIDIPRSVKRASTRMSQAMGGLPGPESLHDDSTAVNHKRSTSTPQADAFEFPKRRPVPPPPAAEDPAEASTEAGASVPPAATLPASRFMSGTSTDVPAPAYPVEEHWVTRQSVRRPLEGAPRPTSSQPSAPPTHDTLAQRLAQEGSLRSPILLDQNLPNMSAASPVLASQAPKSREQPAPEPASTQEMVPDVPSASKMSRQDTIDFNNTLGDLQRALDLLSPRHSRQSRRLRQGMRSSTATDDSLIPTVDESQSSTTPAYIRYGLADPTDHSQDESLSAPSTTREMSALPTQAAPLAAAVAQDLSMSMPRWDPPVTETSAWSAEPTPVAAPQQWGQGPRPSWQMDAAAPASRTMESAPWPRDSMQSQASWSRSSIPPGPGEIQTRDSQSLVSSQLPRSSTIAEPTEPPIPRAEPEEAPTVPGVLDVTVPPHDGAWSVRWDPPTEQPPPPPPPKDEEASQTQWMTSPSMPQPGEVMPGSSDDASMQLESVLANLRPREAPGNAPPQGDEWVAWSSESMTATWPSNAPEAGPDSVPRIAQEATDAPSSLQWAQPTDSRGPSAPVVTETGEAPEGLTPATAVQASSPPPSQGMASLAPPPAAWSVDPASLPAELSSGRLTPPNDGPMPVSTMSPMSPVSPNLQAPLPRTSSNQDLERLSTSPQTKGSHFLSKMSPKFKWPRRKREDKRQTPMQVSAPIQGGASDEDLSHLSQYSTAAAQAQGPPHADASTPPMPSPLAWDGAAAQASPQPSYPSTMPYVPTQGPNLSSPLMPSKERTSVSTSNPSFVFDEPPRRQEVPNTTEPSTTLSDMYQASIDGKNAGPAQS